ncbi:transient receptor potential cation channel subfamily V member 6-like [Dreissena polymorpha]|uniref:Ion transport domain-containing protein n=1 Tax=Dreissena polymorpha TaxID=45954 RepID=A0A9D4J5V0_DREPO|nr:transient receptor potential cation channel subfamily V member 6-like [Dreissena polymorpha]KAH3797134.1 hypothetical protein DPMN_150709 [Dreissena polymorpha]
MRGPDESFVQEDDDEAIRRKYADSEDLYGVAKDIAELPSTAEKRFKYFVKIVRDIAENSKLDKLLKAAYDDDRKGETVLHMVIRLYTFETQIQRNVVEILINTFPKLLLQERSQDSKYAGQTPLHLAICKGNVWLVNNMLRELASDERYSTWLRGVLEKRAYGTMFRNTVMMGELPLFISALTMNKDMYNLLLHYGASIDAKNSMGDNVCHSIIRYAHLYPDKGDALLEMCQAITEDPNPHDWSVEANRNRKMRKKIWLMENRARMTPLQAAASFGLHRIFAYIMNLEIYCNIHSHDGLFDIQTYDVTELDAISSMTRVEITGDNGMTSTLPENLARQVPTSEPPHRQSVLMMLLELDPSVAFHFLLFTVMRRLISMKWKAYRIVFYIMWLFHFLYMCFLTWYAVERAQQIPNSVTANGSVFDINLPPQFKRAIPEDRFALGYGIINLIVASFYISIDIVRMVKGKMRWTEVSFKNPYSNGWFRVFFLAFSVCLVIDFFASLGSDLYEHYCLIISVILGWFLMIFYLRALRPFSFFTVLIQKVLIGDVFRFSVILALEIIGFATAMYVSLQGSTAIDDENYSDYGRVLLSMFKLMVGLGDVAKFYETRHPVVCILIFVGFILLTALLMVNALIAMMGRTCVALIDDVGGVRSHDRHWKLQRMSIILYIESILPDSWIHKVGHQKSVQRYNDMIGRRRQMQRYRLEVRALRMDEDNIEGNTRLQTIKKTLGRPLSAISDNVRRLFRIKTDSSKERHLNTPETKKDSMKRKSKHRDVEGGAAQGFGVMHQSERDAAQKQQEPGIAHLDVYHIRHNAYDEHNGEAAFSRS